jgi:O-antigen/teichoic acid export membrane protein
VLSVGTAVATVIQSLTTLGLTKLISVSEFGAWREFVLFAGFTGVLHVGFADGLQVMWCRNPHDSDAPDPSWSVKTLVVTHLGWVGLAALISLALPSIESFPFFVTVVAIYALVWNGSTAMQYWLQCTRQFWRLVEFVVAFPALFMVIALALVLTQAATALHLAVAYCVAAAAASTLMFQRRRHSIPSTRWDKGNLAYVTGIVRSGLPILALNYSVLGIVNFDKIAASLLFPAVPFAMYGFAAALLALMNSVIAGGSRVMLPALARHAAAGSLSSAVRPSTNTLVLVWATTLLSYFPAAAAVARFLPRYLPALPITRIFFVGSIFLAVPQILHLNACRALGVERKYLKSSLVILAAALPTALILGHVAGMAVLPPLSILVTLLWTAVGAKILTAQGVPTHDLLTLITVVWVVGFFLVASLGLGPGPGAVLYVVSLVPIWGWRYWSRIQV